MEEQTTFDLLLSAAEAGQWDYVDEHIGAFANADAVLAWIVEGGLANPDENVRDLAASLWEKSDRPFLPGVAEKLADLAANDSGKYVRFRAACALCAHGDRSSIVTEVIRGFVDDPDVSSIAQRYLAGR